MRLHSMRARTQCKRPHMVLPAGQNFRLGPLVSDVQKSRDEQKKGHSLRRCSNFGSTSSDEQNKVIASADDRILARNKKKKHHRVRKP